MASESSGKPVLEIQQQQSNLHKLVNTSQPFIVDETMNDKEHLQSFENSYYDLD